MKVDKSILEYINGGKFLAGYEFKIEEKRNFYHNQE